MKRTEYTIVHTEKNGKKHFSTYAKKYVLENYTRAKNFYEKRGDKVELFKNTFIGNSLYKSEKIETV